MSELSVYMCKCLIKYFKAKELAMRIRAEKKMAVQCGVERNIEALSYARHGVALEFM